MGQIFLANQNIGLLTKVSGTQLSMAATYQGQPVRIAVGGQMYSASAALSLNTGTIGFGGLDAGALVLNTLYYVYAVQSNGALGLVASTNSLLPTGFTSAKQIGRFRTFVGSAAIAEPINVIIGNNQKGSENSPWQSYVPVFTSLGVVVVNTAAWRREAGSIRVNLRAAAGTPLATAGLIDHPAGLSYASVRGELNIGKWIRNNGGGTQIKNGVMLVNTSQRTNVYFSYDEYTVPASPFSAVVGTNLFNTAEVFAIEYCCEIQEYVGLFD